MTNSFNFMKPNFFFLKIFNIFLVSLKNSRFFNVDQNFLNDSNDGDKH